MPLVPHEQPQILPVASTFTSKFSPQSSLFISCVSRVNKEVVAVAFVLVVMSVSGYHPCLYILRCIVSRSKQIWQKFTTENEPIANVERPEARARSEVREARQENF